jgi:hypothetical protein
LQAIDSNISAALISAVVAFVIVFLNTFVLEPRRRRGEEKELRKQQLSTWSSDMKSNLSSLQDRKRHLDKLDVDDRPLDRLALVRAHRDLVGNMTEVRRRMLVVNQFIDVYYATLGMQLPYLVMSDAREAKPLPTEQAESGETDLAMRIKDWRDRSRALIDRRKEQLLPKVTDLIEALERALELENGGS